MMLPAAHPQRVELSDEVHARPPEALRAPSRISYLALVSDESEREAHWRSLCALAAAHGAAPPRAGVNHHRADLGGFRLTWERHTEFTRYAISIEGAGEDPFAEPALARVPADWLAELPGRLMVAAHVALLPASDALADHDAVAARWFDGNVLVGSRIGGGAASALTDFRIRPDGFGRFLVVDHGLTRRQAGRMVQRLLEIDTYRMMALLALPVARGLGPMLGRAERELAQVTTGLTDASEADEPLLLERLTRLEAETESRLAETHYRFSAAGAYDELVHRRIEELREERIQGLQTFREFTDRRLAPAMSTCRATAGRLEGLSQRVARATDLLSTRVEISRERQSQALLESMNRRAALQLRLQETVEGLSVIAITYYGVGLVGYVVKALHVVGVAADADLVMGLSIPVVALTVAFGVRQIRRLVVRGRAGSNGEPP